MGLGDLALEEALRGWREGRFKLDVDLMCYPSPAKVAAADYPPGDYSCVVTLGVPFCCVVVAVRLPDGTVEVLSVASVKMPPLSPEASFLPVVR